MPETRVFSGGQFPKVEDLVTVDDVTILGDGTAQNPLRTAPTPPATVVTDGVTVEGDGTPLSPIQLVPTGVAAGNYTNANLTVDADGRIITASNGSSGGTVHTDGVTIAGDGSLATPIALAAVIHDGSMVGVGTFASPLGVGGIAQAQFFKYFEDFLNTGAVFLSQSGNASVSIGSHVLSVGTQFIGTCKLHVDTFLDDCEVDIAGYQAVGINQPLPGAQPVLQDTTASAFNFRCIWRVKVGDDETTPGASSLVLLGTGTSVNFTASRLQNGNNHWFAQGPGGPFDTGVAVDTVLPHIFEIRQFSSDLFWFIDGVEVASTSAGFISSLSPLVEVTSDDHGANDVYVDYIAIEADVGNRS